MMADPMPTTEFMTALLNHTLCMTDNRCALSQLRRAIIDNTKGDLFWIGEILLNELEKETGFKG